ncbi:acyltransferase family protein [Oscillatoria sp. CS-180]|uniref:acyltransferase family protein n=1 Tax=Oscillatoria sp. CS-180 TaxID=3021720 RepID=UPI00232ED0D8|nr:acyltransferase family protein [Oscillatoria sp. CS-180]MDB9527789.1 acyltransferase family protein [Oscillatoria sp. CS-180]
MDNLRVFLTMLVVAHHAAQPYGPTGGEWPLFNSDRAVILGPFFAVNAAFFMGLFFFISGYFLPEACDRKGAKKLLQSRLRRLGIPVLFFVFLVFPPVLYVLTQPSVSFWIFLQVYVKQREIEVAHLWFLLHLLVYTVVYGLWRQIVRHKAWQTRQPPGHGLIAGYGVALSLTTFLVRIEYPIDRWVHLFGMLPIEIAHFPQYVSLFILGILAYRHNWLWEMPTRRGLTWLSIGLGAGLLRYGYSLTRTRFALPDLIAGGGFGWRALIWSGWETTICVGLCLGLLVLFRERCNVRSSWSRLLSANAYGVYLIHLLVVLYLQFLVVPLAIAPLAKFTLVTIVGTPVCFALSNLLRRSRWIKFVIS